MKYLDLSAPVLSKLAFHGEQVKLYDSNSIGWTVTWSMSNQVTIKNLNFCNLSLGILCGNNGETEYVTTLIDGSSIPRWVSFEIHKRFIRPQEDRDESAYKLTIEHRHDVNNCFSGEPMFWFIRVEEIPYDTSLRM